MRLFIGWPLPLEQKAALEVRIETLRSALPASWARPEALHLTLLFLGETDSGRVPRLIEALGALSERAALGVALAGAGFFPSAKRPRVAWIGVEPVTPIRDLAHAVHAAAGAAPGEKEFHPHLTLARIRGSWRSSEVGRFERALAGVRLEGILDRIVLFESRLSRGGAQHVPLHEVRLDPGAQSRS
ncbi:MAG: RNA 2',3'-cyclic phosphodiesterase [Thermoanaerobaculia bacterium]